MQDLHVVEHLSLQTPNYQRTLVEDLSIELPVGQGLLVMRSSGCGKSSLLRAIAGLQNSCLSRNTSLLCPKSYTYLRGKILSRL